MSEPKPVFDNDYVTGQQTKASVVTKPDTTATTRTIEVTVEEKRYGSGKPKRVVIRAQITND